MDKTLERIISLIPQKENGAFKHGALKDFAESIGLSSGNVISDWISGRSHSYKRKLYEISSKYNVSVEWLKGETDEKEMLSTMSKVDPRSQKAAEFFRTATEEEQDMVLSYMQWLESRRTNEKEESE